MGKFTEKKKAGRKTRSRRLGQRGGGTGFLFVFIFFFLILGIFTTFLNIVKGQHRVAAAHRDETVNLQLADSAMDQTLSKIRNHDIVLPIEYGATSATPLPVTITIPVGIDAYTTTAYARIDYVKAANTPVRDIEGNLTYQVQSVVESATGIGTNVKLNMRRGIKADFTVVNFGRYTAFTFQSDQKSFGNGAFNGPYHCNSTVTMNGNCDWNDYKYKFQSSTPTPNPFYDPSYTTVTGVSFVNGGSMNYASVTLQSALPSNSGSYSTLPTSASPLGTWIDAAHGGFSVTPPSIPYSQFNSLAQVIIQHDPMYSSFQYQRQLLPSGNGTINLSAPLTIDAGIASKSSAASTEPIRLNLGALNHGANVSGATGVYGDFELGDGLLGDTDAQAQANYDSALSSAFGLIIYVDTDVAVWGTLPDATGSINTNKKVTIVTTGDVYMIGDILVSDSPYLSGTLASYNISASPTVDNPNDDAIAFLAGGSGVFFVDPWRGLDNKFFVNNGSGCGVDMRMDALLYGPNGDTGGFSASSDSSSGDRKYESAIDSLTGNTSMGSYTFHGSVVVKTSGDLPSNCTGYFRVYDPRLKYNLSAIIPSGTSVTSWQEDVNPPQLP